MEESTYYLKCMNLVRQLETVTRALHDAQEALDTERAMRKLERSQRLDDENRGDADVF